VVQPDRELVERSRSGDRAAFEELVRRTARLVFARAYLETGDNARAEDLTQETFLLAWRSVRQVKDVGSFRPWLMSILHRVVVDAARREGRKKRSGPGRSESAELDQVADDRAGPEQTAERDEQRQRALAELRSLPEEYREVLMLRYLAGADYEEIGRQLAISNGSLRGLLNRGLAMLRARMQANEKKS
jgi:RNA polymerase sigma-70 factor (ECF subfamily)